MQVATTETYPLIVYIYSGVVNVFVPSGGSKWLIEAPYLLPAARDLAVSPTTTLLAYCYGDSTSNLIQPFWAIPILNRDPDEVRGHTRLQRPHRGGPVPRHRRRHAAGAVDAVTWRRPFIAAAMASAAEHGDHVSSAEFRVGLAELETG